MKYLNKLEDYICRILLVLFVTLLFIQVILRNFFNYGLPWIEELSRFAFVWFAFFGAAYAAKLNAHNRVELHLKLLPKPIYNGIILLIDLIWIAFNLAIAWKAIIVIKELTEFPYQTPSLGWSLAYIYYIFPISFILMSIRILQVQYNRLFRGLEPDDVEGQDIKDVADIAKELKGTRG